MSRPLLIILGVFSALIVTALIFSSMGPQVIQLPQPPVPSTDRRIASAPEMGARASSLPVYRFRLPEFKGITKWWNTANGEPLTPEKLQGKVVFIDFWTYSCINCIRTYPFLRSMHAAYADKGLVIIGVHTPEFAFEADPRNVEREMQKNGIVWPIALDPDYATWNAYSNRYWPAGYFFDGQGRLRRVHFGEGDYEESELAIRSLLQENGAKLDMMGTADTLLPDFSKIKTPETYFGLARGTAYKDVVGPDNVDVQLAPAASLDPNTWTAAGTWRFRSEYVEARSPGAVFRMSVQASKMHLVMESNDAEDKKIEVYVDGVKVKDLIINASGLYNIADFADAKRHTVELRIQDAGVRFFAATFS